MDPTSSAVAPEQAAPERATFWRRLGAYVIDTLVTVVLAAVGSRPLSGLFPHAVEQMLAMQMDKMSHAPNAAVAARMGSFAEMGVRFGIAAGLIMGVYMLIEGLYGRALGKLILGLRIATAEGRAAPVGQLLLRMLVKYAGAVVQLLWLFTGVVALSKVSQILGFVVLGGCLIALWPRRQALHDLVAKTAVYHASDVRD
jgi:uncharacterized RDD family membrane protein YckC